MLNSWIESTIAGPRINAAFTQGDNIAWAWAVSVNGAPLNLTGMLITMTIRNSNGNIVLTSSNGGITVSAPTTGAFIINISSTQTAGIVPGQYEYDIWLEPTISPPNENQYFVGSIIVNQSIKSVP